MEVYSEETLDFQKLCSCSHLQVNRYIFTSERMELDIWRKRALKPVISLNSGYEHGGPASVVLFVAAGQIPAA